MASELKINIGFKYSLLFHIVKNLPFLIGFFWDKKAFDLYVNDKFDKSFTFRDVLNY